MRAANTSQEALKLAHADGVPLGDLVQVALRVARDIVPPSVAVEMFAIDRQGRFVGEAR